MEFYRIFSNKKVIWIIVFLIFLNGFLFCKEQWKWDSYGEFKQEKEYGLELLSSIKKCSNTKEAMDFLSEKSDTTEENQWKIAQFYGQLTYIDNYNEQIEKIEENARQLRATAIFGEGNKQYIEENITATTNAYKKLKGLNLSIGNDTVITAILSFKLVGIINLAVMFIIISLMMNDRRCGLSKITYTAANGRYILAMRRSGIIVGMAFIITAINMGIILALSTYFYGGYVDYGRYVQSISLFENFVYPISIGEFLLLYFILSAVVLLLLSYIIWFILLVVKNSSIAILVLSILGIAEYLFSSRILVQSSWKLLKYINVIEYFNISNYIYKYYNFELWNHAVNAFWFIVVGIIVMLIIFALLSCIAFSNIRPCEMGNRIVQIYGEKISTFLRKFQEHIRSFGTECYKILVINKGIFIIAVLMLVILEMNAAKSMNYSDGEQYTNKFYKEFTGKIGKNVYKNIASEYKAIEEAKRNYERVYQLYKQGEADKMDVFEAEFKVESYKGAEEALPDIEENINRLEDIKKNRGIDGWLINERAYNKLLGKDSTKIQMGLAGISLLAVILLFSSNFSFERKSNMSFLLRSCPNGRKNLLLKKVAAVSIITVAIITVFYGCVFLYINNQYGISGLGAPVQSITLLESVPYNINIITYLIITHIIKCLLYMIVAHLILFFSMYLPQKASMVIFMIVLTIPVMAEYFNIEIVSHISLFSLLYIDRMIINQEGILENIIKACILLLGTILIAVRNGKKWCHT